jgi:glycosyltransferase involved in cell wall biosynthesis
MITDAVSDANPILASKATRIDCGIPRAERPRPKVVIGHPMLGRGGSESVVMWLIESLKNDCDVTVATTGGWDRSSLNEFYGTQVEENEIGVRTAALPWPLQSRSVAALRGAVYQRLARRIAAEYDVRISAYNLTDWGLPAIHFLADFSWNKEIRDRIDPPSPGFVYKDSLLRKAYLGLASAIESPSGRDPLVQDQLIANSQWTAKTALQHCNVECAATIYPPVSSEFSHVSWENKEDSFVMIGRIAPEKQIEKAISILRSVRDRGNSIKLHLCGEIGNDLYGRRIAELCRNHSDWIIQEGRVTGDRKAAILAQCRYGIHARSAEPFGISVAEMVKAGAIVFAPHEGGQSEILHDPNLLFNDQADAVEKICRVLENPSHQSAISSNLRDRAQSFSTSSFISSVHDLLLPALQQSVGSGNADVVTRA